MSAHQIIYTSCMRGINGVNDGQQIFSYDVEFEDSNNDEIKRLFSYQPPALESGVIMTEEIAATLPQSFIYRKLDNGKCALALNTYLGRDYMGSTGRFGNHLSHVVIADETDIVNYPCEFYGGTLLRNQMEFEEVNNPEPPDFLSAPILEKGYVVDADSVLEFLGLGDRLEIYKNMLHAMLIFERERKRVVICDTPENIIMWIAALEYAIPLKTALNINFATYEYDPELSAAQICGVVRNGTRYAADSRQHHFVFDIEQNNWAQFEKDEEFCDFIDTAFTFSFDSIRDFHAFLAKGYKYEKANEDIYCAYALYTLLSDGITAFSKGRLKSALGFAHKYAHLSEKVKIARKILSNCKELSLIDKEVFLYIMQFVFSVWNTLDSDEQAMTKASIVDKVLCEFSDAEIDKISFEPFYNNAVSICGQHQFDLSTELMLDKKREKLFDAIRNDIPMWKIAFMVNIVSTYVKECHIPVSELTSDKMWGNAYQDIVKMVYSQCPEKGLESITCILREFADDSADFTNMALNIEGMLSDIPGEASKNADLWECYRQILVSGQKVKFSTAYYILICHKRYEQVFALFKQQLEDVGNITELQNLFANHIEDIAKIDDEYALKYEQNILEIYFDKLDGLGEEETVTAKIDLLDLIVSRKLDTGFMDKLIAELLRRIPYKRPSGQDAHVIKNIILYTCDFMGKSATGKLFLIQLGLMFEYRNNQEKLKEIVGESKALAQNGKANFTGMSDKEIEDYFTWILPVVCNMCQNNDEMNMIFELFDMSDEVASMYFLKCAKFYLKQCRERKAYDVFAEYFQFACVYGDTQIREEMGRMLRKLNRNRLINLDIAIREKCDDDELLIRYWEEIRRMAEQTNPIISNISNLFRKGKRED